MFLDANASFSRKTNNQRWPYSADKDWAAEVGFVGGTTNPVARGPAAVRGQRLHHSRSGVRSSEDLVVQQLSVHRQPDLDPRPAQHEVRRRLPAHPVLLAAVWRYARPPHVQLGRIHRRDDGGHAARLGQQLARASWTRRGPYHLVSNYSGFVQDDFKITPTLTLNIGLRYELMKPPQEKYGALVDVHSGARQAGHRGHGQSLAGRVRPAHRSIWAAANIDAWRQTSGCRRPSSRPDNNNFAPRFGFAWRPFGNTTTVIRGGYGIFYGSSSLYRMDEYSDTYPVLHQRDLLGQRHQSARCVTASNPYPAGAAQRQRRHQHLRAGRRSSRRRSICSRGT